MRKILIIKDNSPVVEPLQAAMSKGLKSEVRRIDANQQKAWSIIRNFRPDVIVIDYEFLEKIGMSFLHLLNMRYPCELIFLIPLKSSSLDKLDSNTKFAGIPRVILPKDETRELSLIQLSNSVIKHIRDLGTPSVINVNHAFTETVAKKKTARKRGVIAIGVSAGGPPTLRELLKHFTKDMPGVLIVQHMPAGFVPQFAERLNEDSPLHISVAVDGAKIMPGTAHVAMGSKHMKVVREGASYHIKLEDGPPACGHRPSADILFRSVAEAAGNDAVGIILTGMGNDGAEALKVMRDKGAHTIAQSEKSCIVFGMPKMAIRHGAAKQILDLEDIPAAVAEAVYQ